ncbi:hypothetical protein N7516_004638 [Penicillium verrucosum]|uniref:uncharacterized protein n=1 Tax=Penicillium verrucosum TaxID=60171 RepID=UPI0025451DF0|nr:uncharacterized protein N7516_004638 [Penicillium verrucosum]KAJ5944470.1 hypothetical protein N7516_004638 [Penicillium verrucosum]
MISNSSLAARRRVVPAGVNTTNHEWFYPKKTVENKRPNSGATVFDDTDSEGGDWGESHRQSMQSLSYGSNTTLSSPELPTPDLVPRTLPTFRSSKELIAGPSGPDLFRESRGSTVDVEFYLAPSPTVDFTPSLTQPEFVNQHQAGFVNQYHSEFTNPYLLSPKTPKAFPPNPDVSHLSEEEIRNWDPSQVAHWLFIGGYAEDVRDTFIKNDICGDILMALTEDELKDQLLIQSMGKRRKIFNSIKYLKQHMQTRPIPETPSQFPSEAASSNGRTSPGSFTRQEFAPQEFAPQEFAPQGFAPQGFAPQEFAPQEFAPQGFAPQEFAPRGTPPTGRSYTVSVSPNGQVLSSNSFGQTGDQNTTAESVSIVGIEEFHPKPHRCSKGKNCSKYKRLQQNQQRRLEKLAAEYPDTDFQGADFQRGAIFVGSPGNPDTARNLLRPMSDAELSVVASSDIFGPRSGPRLSEAALSEVGRLDPQETIRNFLRHQHVDDFPKPGPLGLDTYNLPPPNGFDDISPPNAQSNSMAANLRNLPKLTIPTSPVTEDMTTAVTTNRYFTPTHQNGSPTAVQQFGPFSHAHQTQAIETYRQGTPFSEVDVPITAIPSDPIPRDVSQSVPPGMQYGTLFPPYRSANSLERSTSTLPSGDLPLRDSNYPPRSTSTRPSDDLPLRDSNYLSRRTSNRSRDVLPLRQVKEDKPLTPIDVPADLIRSPRVHQHGTSGSMSASLASDPDVTHAGYMKKRKTTRLLRHEWSDAHFTLRGTNLAMHKDERDAHRVSRALDNIEVDEYAVACSSLATSSKLTAAFKRSILRNGNNTIDSRDGTAFAFSLIPATRENEKKALFGNNAVKSHHFAVKSREDRIDWMRELMLAKALKKGRDGGDDMLVNGNVI